MNYKPFLLSLTISTIIWVYPPNEGMSQVSHEMQKNIPVRPDTVVVKWDSAYNARKRIMSTFTRKQMVSIEGQEEVAKEVVKLQKEVASLKKRLAMYPEYIIKQYTFEIPHIKKTGWLGLKTERYTETILKLDTIYVKDYMTPLIISDHKHRR